MITLIVVILGGLSLSRLQIDLLPTVELPSLTVRTAYEGASPEVMERLVTRAFHRLRLGVGDERQSHDLANHVLSRFHPDEFDAVREMSDRAEDAMLMWIKEGGTAAINRYNG